MQTPGNMIDLKAIQEDVERDSELHVVAEVAMDAWGSREIAPSLQAGGFTVVDVPMTTRNLSEPMKLIAALVDAGRFHHDGNLASVWMFANVEVFEDRNENVFPRKSKPENKIDAAVATILAVGRAMAGAGWPPRSGNPRRRPMRPAPRRSPDMQISNLLPSWLRQQKSTPMSSATLSQLLAGVFGGGRARAGRPSPSTPRCRSRPCSAARASLPRASPRCRFG